jgi:23S rRNA (guanosine2251-2'-O)-methyltransferase
MSLPRLCRFSGTRYMRVIMKPPHGNRPGGSSRPPSDRGPHRGPGGPAPRPPSYGGGGSAGGGHRSEARGGGGGGPKAGDAVHRDHAKVRHDGPRPGGKPAANGAAARGDFQSRPPPRDAASQGQQRDPAAQRSASPQRFSAPPQRQREYDAPRSTPDAPKGTVWLYGHHAVAAALANPARRLRRLLLTEESEAAITRHLPPPWAVSPERVDRGRLDHLLGRDVVHQGAALLADPLAPPSLGSVLEKPGVIIVLDQVTDPRNVGAIMRSAAAFGAAAVITQDRNAPEETGGLAKAASGALEKMPLLRAVNIARTIIALKAANIWCIGLDSSGAALSGPAFADRRVALVLGAEGEGLRRLTRETCDEIAGLTTKGAVESLNVSAAATVALYELSRR